MEFKPAKRLESLGSAIFTEILNRKKRLFQRGVDIIDLGIGSPNHPPAPELIAEFKKALDDPLVYPYPNFQGNEELKDAIAKWYKFRFGVDIDEKNGEVLVLMGSQDGLAHLPQALLDPGDIALVPDPGYPIYSVSIELAGGIVYPLPLLKENNYLPDFSQIPVEILTKAKLMILNYPSNPLAEIANLDFFAEVVEIAKKYNIIVAHDVAYSEMAFDGYRPPSFLQVAGAKEVGIEFNSLSKSFNLAGTRIGYVVGNKEIIKPLMILKSHIDYGVFEAVQRVATKALLLDIERPNQTFKIYQERRDVLVPSLKEIGWDITPPKGTMFVWAEVPKGWKSQEFAFQLLEETGVVVIPGDAFGRNGEGFVRIGLVQEKEKLVEAVERIAASNILFARK